MELTKSMQFYFDELASGNPTPGGGNVAALCGALSSSLGMMVCNLTIGKKKYADVEPEMINLNDKLGNYRELFFKLSQLDNEAFEKVMAAFKLPKDSDDQKEVRLKEIENATIGAAEIPSEVLKNCFDILPYLKTIILKGNKNSISDAGVAVSLADTSAKAAYMNILINCSSLSNQTVAGEIKKRSEVLFNELTNECTALTDLVFSSIGRQ